ncbi:MAG TPA: MEDS domain-containing protein, partial [Nitrosopumilaceae archaeon]|nr:MEDS domain-containing protein [Nitrosopumilaceae archaeon]
LTHEDPKIIKDEMNENEINVKEFVQKNLLQIQQITSPEKDPKGILQGYDNIVKQAIADKKPPYRIVGKIMPNTEIEEAMSVQLVIERMAHAMFEKLNSTILCTYDINEIPTNNYKMWLSRLYSYHHAAIVSIRDGTNMAGYL